MPAWIDRIGKEDFVLVGQYAKAQIETRPVHADSRFRSRQEDPGCPGRGRSPQDYRPSRSDPHGARPAVRRLAGQEDKRICEQLQSLPSPG